MLPPVAGCGKSLQRAVSKQSPSVPLLFGVVVQRFRDASMPPDPAGSRRFTPDFMSTNLPAEGR